MLLTPRPVAGSVEELVADATSRTPMTAADSKSGATFERVVIDGDAYVLKHVSPDRDWIARACGDVGPWTVRIWSSGLLDHVPDGIDHTYAGAACTGRDGAVLMHDVGPWLVPEGDVPVAEADHLAFLDRLAALHASFWGWTDDVGLLPLANRFFMFGPWMVACEEALDFPELVPVIARDGWVRLRELAPAMSAVLEPLTVDPSPLVEALESTPLTFVHGDTKTGNLGRHPDGRVILIDWALPGRSAGCLELAHYLALNRSRIPSRFTPEATIAAYRDALERHGIDTAPWWERQLALSLLGIMVQLGWEKALGPPDDLAWWQTHVREGAELLDSS
ncbi:MAG TPA: aminoglycoside phosphotransferase [Acidimicrobiia bacterium]